MIRMRCGLRARLTARFKMRSLMSESTKPTNVFRRLRNYVQYKLDHIADDSFRHLTATDILNLLRRQGLLLCGEMAKLRNFRIKLFGFEILNYRQSLSTICGHLSFICMAIAYLERDFLMLRIYAVSGLSLISAFQYFRPYPIWFMLQWNALFIGINLTMIYMILKEETDAKQIPKEQLELYNTTFRHQGMKPVEFRRLMTAGKRTVYNKGDVLIQSGEYHSRLHLLKRGKVSVRLNGQIRMSVDKNHFAGSWSFLKWIGTVDAQRQAKALTREKTREMLQRQDYHPDILINLLFGVADLAGPHIERAMKRFGDIMAAAVDVDRSVPDYFNDTGAAHGGMFLEPISFADTVMVPRNLMDELEDEEDHFTQGIATVVCEEECVVFSWSFNDLHSLFAHEPQLGLVFERCVSADLSTRMNNAWKEEFSSRYKQLLHVVLESGEITEKERKAFEKYRYESNISYDDHLKALNEFGWTEEDYQRGILRGNSDIDTYFKMVQDTLSKKNYVGAAVQKKFLDFRTAHNISFDHHLKALSLANWTYDDYEIGQRTMKR